MDTSNVFYIETNKKPEITENNFQLITSAKSNIQWFFEDNEINKIALIAPQAKLNIIKDYEVVEKKVVEIQEQVTGIVKCFNPKCITNKEKIITKFTLVDRENVILKCHYCEKVTMQEHFTIL